MRTWTKPDSGADSGADYWAFQTGRGIFSVPAVSADGFVLIGSADRKFYALDEATGKEFWRISTGEIIDSAAAIHGSNVIFASGDGHVYNASYHTGAINWKFAAHHQAETADQNQGFTCGESEFISANGGTSTWFEGQVAISPIDGRVYVGNDDYRLYSIYANGSEAYSFYPGPLPYGTIWSGPAITRSGSVIGTAMNGKYFKLDRFGKCIWFHEEMNSISSGPAVEADLRLVFIGSWNGIMRGVNHTTGHTVWTFSAADQIYGGVAVDAARRQIYFGSQDGVFYALNSETGKSVWRFRVNYPIRTSPALALDAVYFGAANGMIYALNPVNGHLIWAFDTTEDPDHREINASPALGHASVIFGSEDGRIISVPYRYCLDEKTKHDKRCFTDSKAIGVTSDEGRNLYYVYPGGIISRTLPEDFPIEGEFHIRLLIVSGQQDTCRRMSSKQLLNFSHRPTRC
ncbi:quinon protein alcohol dehydrogenase-like superfamily [Obelidium mucronatum]|nr:quinon protein alcohol dehydrogenase-like superfamily [Obelidium mucronatum]